MRSNGCYEIYMCNKSHIHCSAQCKELFFHSGDGWGKKNFPLNYLQKHKHMPEEFESNNLAPWFKLWAPCMKTGRPHTTFPWSLHGVDPGRDPLWGKACLDPTATEEFHVFTSSEVWRPCETSRQSDGSHFISILNRTNTRLWVRIAICAANSVEVKATVHIGHFFNCNTVDMNWLVFNMIKHDYFSFT